MCGGVGFLRLYSTTLGDSRLQNASIKRRRGGYMKTAHQMCGLLCIYGRQVTCLSKGGGGRQKNLDHKIKRGWLKINQWLKIDQSFCDSSSSRMIFSSISSAITSLARSSLCSTTSVNIPMVLPSNSNALTLLASESASLDSFMSLSRT